MIISDIVEFWHTRAWDQNLTQFCFKILQKRQKQTVHEEKKEKNTLFSKGHRPQ